MRSLAAKPDLTAQAHEAIRNAIIALDLAPGAPLAQEDLAERLGVSRQPVSHALVLLRREGLVVDRGRKGQMVAPIDPDRILNLYQVRGALDRLAASLAAERAGGEAGAADQLSTLVTEGRMACKQGTVDDLVRADLAFHQALYRLSGNAEIDPTATTFWPHMVRSMRMILRDAEARGHEVIWDEHAAIAEAVIDGDPERAGTLAAGHAERAGNRTYGRLRQA